MQDRIPNGRNAVFPMRNYPKLHDTCQPQVRTPVGLPSCQAAIGGVTDVYGVVFAYVR